MESTRNLIASGAIIRSFEPRTDDTTTAVFAITKIVHQAMAPFEPGRIFVSLEPKMDLVSREGMLVVDIQAMRAYPFRFKYDERQITQAYYPEDWMIQSIAKPLFNHIRYRPAVPVEEHIILGED